MRRCLQVILVVISILVWSSTGTVAGPKVTAASYILLEASNYQPLVEANAFERRPPASTTKILTGITAIDLANLGELVVVSPKAAKVGDASIYLQTGEVFTLEDLIKGALINSGNDATVAIAEQVAGDEKLFMDLSNRKARILGAVRTEFFNPHGLPHDQHLTTAYDLALITRYSLSNPVFSAIVGTKETTISSLNSNRKVYLSNTNRLLWSNSYVKGVKTGTTIRAGKCLVSAAEIDGRSLVAVVLRSNDRFGDSQRLLDWGFQQFSLLGIEATKNFWVVDVPNGSPACITVKPIHNIAWSVPKGSIVKADIELPKQILAPIRKGDLVGRLMITLDDQLLETVSLVAGEDALPQSRIGSLVKKFNL